MTKSTIHNRRVIGLVFSTIVGMTMAGSAMAGNCMGSMVSNCSEVMSKQSCSNMYQDVGGKKYQCMSTSNGMCSAGPICQ
jgi:hypothetical protein